MLHAKEYEIMTSENGTLFFAIDVYGSEPDKPILIYDGGNHATFYRNSEDVILLDYINKNIQKALKESDYIVVAEIDYESERVVRDYKARIKTFKKNPFTDGLK